jgi:DNA primase
MFLDSLVAKLHDSIYRYPEALQYLQSRGITEEEIKEYHIGASRVVVTPNDGSQDYENFQNETARGRKYENKVVFPIYDMIGRVVGLFGRSITAKEFKFILTAEAKFTGVLLGFYQALPYIYETGKVFVVEGPFDLMSFRKVYKNSVAALTAGLSDNQYSLLQFFAKTIITVFDSDAPGQRATEEAKEKWSNVISMSLGYHDPDKCREVLGKGFEKYVRSKVNGVVLF